MKKNILGIKIDDVNIDQALDVVQRWLQKAGKHYIVTPNPEIVVMAQRVPELKKIINNADLAIPDGAGLKLSGDIVNTTPGIDLMEQLVKLASEKGFTTGFLGGRGKVAEQTVDCLKKKYPKLKVVFAESGGEIDSDGNVIARSNSDEAILLSNRLPRPFGARNNEVVDLLFVAFGPPKQEKWIANNLSRIQVKVAMTVGGAFDVLSGRIPRAPKLMRSLNLEWLFRLIIQPWRIKRQLALVKYILLLLSWNNDIHQKS